MEHFICILLGLYLCSFQVEDRSKAYEREQVRMLQQWRGWGNSITWRDHTCNIKEDNKARERTSQGKISSKQESWLLYNEEHSQDSSAWKGKNKNNAFKVKKGKHKWKNHVSRRNGQHLQGCHWMKDEEDSNEHTGSRAKIFKDIILMMKEMLWQSWISSRHPRIVPNTTRE